MKTIKITAAIIITISLYSCSIQKAPRTITAIFKQEQFDASVINRLYLYDSLKNVIVRNANSIFDYRDSIDVTYPIQPRTFYNFIYIPGSGDSHDKIGSNTLPPKVLVKIEEICRQIGSERISGFDLTSRNQLLLNIVVKGRYDKETTAEIQHALLWDWAFSNSTESRKDTSLGNGWTYTISVEKRKGR